MINIDKKNANIIKTDVYIHDDILKEFLYNKTDLVLVLEKYGTKSIYQIIFKNIIGFLKTSCDFWGASQQIFDFEYLDKHQLLLPRLLEKYYTDKSFLSKKIDDNKYIEVLITLKSGDTFSIVCEQITITDYNHS